MIIDHVGISTSEYERSRAFFSQAFAPLGLELVREMGTYAGFGKSGVVQFWI